MLGTFFTISAENVSTTMSYVSGLIDDLMPLLLIIMAVGIGLIIFVVIVNTIRGGKD
jgi:hypothetical protein